MAVPHLEASVPTPDSDLKSFYSHRLCIFSPQIYSITSQESPRAQPGIRDLKNNENKANSASYQQWDSRLRDAGLFGS